MMRSLIYLFLLAMGIHYSGSMHAQVVINEFMASNSRVLWDRDHQRYSDWIELHNVGSEAVDLSGWHLTDNLSKPLKWEIPEGVLIEPGGKQLFWADGKNNGQHTSFKLSIGMDAIGLSNADGKFSDSLTYRMQLRDVSYGRTADGNNKWVYFEQHTAGSPNNDSPGSSSGKRGASPVVSMNGGFVDGSQAIKISSKKPGDIRYTLDGSEVQYDSKVYSGEIAIDSNTILRAKLYSKDNLASQEVTHSYFTDPKPTLPVVSIITDPVNLWDRYMGIYVNGSKYVKGKWWTSNYLRYWRRPGNIEFFEADGSLSFSAKMRLKVFGIYTSRYGQKPLTLYFDEPVKYPIFGNRDTYTYQSMVLRNSGQDWIRTLMCDGLVNSLVINNIDVDAQAYRPSIVYINGKFWGIQNIREKHDGAYFTAHHNIDPDNVVVLKRSNWGKVKEYNEMLAVVEDKTISSLEKYKYLADHIDIKEFTNYQITEIFSGNRDWPGSNVKAWKPKGDGKWRWLLSDLDVSFGVWNNAQPKENSLIYAVDTSIESTVFLRVLLENENYRNVFIQRFALALNTIFSTERVNHFIDSMSSDIRAQIPNHVERWKDSCSWSCGIKSVEFWEQYIDGGLKYFSNKRPAFLKQYIAEMFNINGMAELTFEAVNGRIAIHGLDWLFDPSGQYFKGIPLSITAIPAPGYEFLRWEGANTSENATIVVMLTEAADLRAIFGPADQHLVPGIISKELKLLDKEKMYYAKGDIEIEPGGRLVLGAGVNLLMSAGANIIVRGGLKLDGSIGQPIVIQANHGSGYDSWGALCFEYAKEKCEIDNIVLKDATYGSNKLKYNAAIASDHSNVSLDNISVVEVYGQPFYSEFGEISITNSKMHTGITSDIINIKYAKKATVENCDLQGNNKPNTDGIDYDNVTNGIIRGNTIYDFMGSNSDGIDLGEGSQDVLIESNTIRYCTDKGISVGQKSTAKIIHNIIIGCNQGVGIKDSSSYALIDKCTFYKNKIGVAVFEKNSNKGGGKAVVTNTIIARSKKSSVWVDEHSTLDITYSLSDMDLTDGKGNIYADAIFMDPEHGDFTLQDTSLGLNAGTPISILDFGKSREHMGVQEDERKVKMHVAYYILLGLIGLAGVYVFGK